MHLASWFEQCSSHSKCSARECFLCALALCEQFCQGVLAFVVDMLSSQLIIIYRNGVATQGIHSMISDKHLCRQV